MTNRTATICLLALILLEGSTFAFFPGRAKSRLPRPLKSAYLETLTVSDKDDNGTFSTASTIGTTTPGSTHVAFPTPQIPIAESGGDSAKSAQELSSGLRDKPTKELERQTVEAEVMPKKGMSTPPDPIPGANGWVKVESDMLGDAKVAATKGSYESEREKYDRSFLYSSGFKSSQEKKLGDEQEADDGTVHQATVVEVLPKDPPIFEDIDSNGYLASKNMELERQNSDLQREMERQQFELESFLRGSPSDPLDHRIPDNRAPWHGDSLVEEHSRLKTENELQRQDLQAIQYEMNGMESIIQSIEDKSYLETQKLEDLNDELRNENARQNQQIETYSMQMSNMQNLIQTIRDEAVSLENEKRKLQSENDVLISKLRGSEGENDREKFELGKRNRQISDLQNVVETLRSDYSKLQSQQDLEMKDKVSLESKFDATVVEFEKQRHELEAYKKDRGSMEGLVRSIKQESESLKSDNKMLQDTIESMKDAMEDISQQNDRSQNMVNILSSEKDEIVAKNQEAQSRLQNELQDSFSKFERLSDEKAEVESRLQSLNDESERQRYEIESSLRDKRALEVMVESMQNELKVLTSEKTTIENELAALQQEKQKDEQQLQYQKEEIERLRNEKDIALSQARDSFDRYDELQLRFQEVVGELEACQEAHMHSTQDFDGVDEGFMSRINSRQQNQMRRNQINDPMNGSWWN